MEYRAIGVIHTPFTEIQGMPIQPAGSAGVKGTVEVFEQYREGLKDVEGFSHLILLYHFHLSHDVHLQVVPFLDTNTRGVFATRAPSRPNPIGLSVVRLERVENGVLYVQDVDMVNGTPLLDIKPYVPEFSAQGRIQTGWLEEARKQVQGQRADSRFR